MTIRKMSFSQETITAEELAARLNIPTEKVLRLAEVKDEGEHFKVGKETFLKRGKDAFSPILTAQAGQVAQTTNNTQEDEQNQDTVPSRAAVEIALATNLAERFSEQYRFVEMDDKKKRVLHSFDARVRELAPASLESMQSEMRFYLGSRATLKEATAATVRCADILQNSPNYRIREKQVAPLLFEGQEGFCYRRLPISADPLTTCPAPFAELLNRCTKEGAESLVLWLGSVLDADSDRSQYLVLYGPGNNGKSTLIDGIVQVLGTAALTMSASDFLNRFGMGDGASARLVAFDDNNNASFMTSGDFKRVTGSNHLRVERKGRDAYRVRNNLKIIIACNRLPKLTGDDADMRRNVFVKLQTYGTPNPETGKVKPGADGGWVRALQEAIPEVLRYCYTQWMAYRKESGKERVPVQEEAHEEIYGVSLAGQVEDFCAEFLVEDKDGWLAPRELHDKATVVARMEPKVYEHLKHFLTQKYPLQRNDATNWIRKYRGVRLASPSDSST